ncbi:non-ribosomal peptide synthetase [Microbulbifer sp. 2205BS26-8]|uniref:non-ribosomal peptide synthetase n=1 Tax=Microbulbifer sp. 2205BS26-8 TaxID=3064386 RepID=UPI00273F8C71|nr:non-ribosomal peptide synthetase [Microbulbifer sp. 2205BS26-8]MDP5209825.1 amino acid adenylation domain-containing protein [Microbulbifer sp. 2205BS26-8]
MSESAIEKLSVAEREKLLKIAKQRTLKRKKMHPEKSIEVISRDQPLPLSRVQQRLWFLCQLDEKASLAYHIAGGVRLQGALDEVSLQTALDQLISRHETLRTVFVSADGKPQQRVLAPETGFAIKRQDFRRVNPVEREAKVKQHIALDEKTPFNLEQGPLIRGQLFQLADREHVLFVSMHHIISDGWSLSIFLRELSVLYSACIQGIASPLAPLPFQYADYAVWQHTQLSSGELLKKQSHYWQQTLANAPLLSTLPSDFERPLEQSYRGSSLPVSLDKTLSQQIKVFCEQQDLTLHMLLLSTWALLLSRLSVQDDIVIGTPMANRSRQELEGLMGFFANTLVLRIDASPTLSGGEFLARAKARSIEAQSYQDIDFEQVVQLVTSERNLSHSPLFQMMFDWKNTSQATLSLAGLDIVPLSREVTTTQFDVLLSLGESHGKISGHLAYACSLYTPETLQRYLHYWQSLLRELISDDQKPIGQFNLLDGVERKQILHEWSGTQVAYPVEQCIHHLFEAQVERTPRAPALIYEDKILSYHELNAQANQLAHYLCEQGVKPDRRVALCVERSLDRVIALLAILKSGGAYVPLDPDHPEERLHFMLADSEPQLLLIDDNVQVCFKQSPCKLVNIETDQHLWSCASTCNPEVEALGPRHLAYVIYTSGSTGQPKGVMNEHRGVVNYLHWRQRNYTLTDADAVLQKTPYSFDVSVWEFFWPLMSGARLVIARPQGHQDLTYLHALIESEQVTALHFVPSMLSVFLEHLPPQSCHSVRQIFCSGEALSACVAKRCLTRLPNSALHNLYGPTEASIDVTAWLCEAESRRVAIGTPIANCRIYIVDHSGQPVPVGVAGELLIGGVCVARGYINRPELTEERFISDPFYDDNGCKDLDARVYKTGDLARWRADGTIEFLGRNDFQVKIRGFRIELSEIEARLRHCGGIKDAVVIADGDSEQKRLLAYCVSDNEILDSDSLRATLQQYLPDYMVPSVYVRLESLPLSSNGKLDRKALTAPDGDDYSRRHYVAAIGEVEQTLAQIWSDLLNIQNISRWDNFFALGGHSLLAMQLLSRMSEAGYSLNIRALFKQPVLSDLAKAVQTARPAWVIPDNGIPPGADSITPEMVTLVDMSQREIDHVCGTVTDGAANIQDIYPLAALQEGILFHHLLNEHSGDAYLLSKLLAFANKDHLDGFVDALQWLVKRHDILRTSVCWEGLSEPVQAVWREAPLVVEALDLSDKKEIANYLLTDFLQGQHMDISQAPLFRVVIIFDSLENRWLLLTLYHHLIMDHAGLDILIKELSAYLVDPQIALAPPPAFRQFVAQGRLGVTQAQHQSFFENLLADIDEPTAPLGLLNTHGDGSAIEEARVCLAPQLSTRLRTLALSQQVSVASLFHLAFARVLGCLSGRDDVVFGTVLLGRMQGRDSIDHAMGMFMNTLPIRIQVGDIGVGHSLQNVQGLLADLLYHEHGSLALAQRCSGIAAPLPLFTALLNYRHSTPLDSESHSSPLLDFELLSSRERSNYPLMLAVDDLDEDFIINVQAVTELNAAQIEQYLVEALTSLVSVLDSEPASPCYCLNILADSQKQQLLTQYNDTCLPYADDLCIHELFERQVEKTPDATALVYEGQSLSYRDLDTRANRLAHYLREQGVVPDNRVGLCLERGFDMLVGMLAILKAGGAYVPLDPSYPLARLQHMLTDSGASIVVTQSSVMGIFAGRPQQFISVDSDKSWQTFPQDKLVPGEIGLKSTQLAYVIYTSGSTGKSKAVMISHQSVGNFFAGMSQRLGESRAPRTWLATTSISFDISVLELLWSLQQGDCVVIQPDPLVSVPAIADKAMDFSLFYFAAEDGHSGANTYDLLLEGARFADQQGLAGVWAPERHFASFGNPFPNPSVAAAAIAAVTQKLTIRAGSVVLPLHDPIRVAEEWSMVDNLSSGRVELSMASGWHPNDFVLAPENFNQRQQILREGIDTVNTLWSGGHLTRENGLGDEVSISLHPQPVQRHLPLWITAAGNPETFRYAGSIGAKLITHLLGQTKEELAEKIAVYHEALAAAGFAPQQGRVALMLHTFVGDDEAEVKALVEQPFKHYLSHSIDLLKPIADEAMLDLEREKERILDMAFKRYYQTSSLMGTPTSCLKQIQSLQAIGVDEIACLIHFGIEPAIVMDHLSQLQTLQSNAKRLLCQQKLLARRQQKSWSMQNLLKTHAVTHLQSTPSLLQQYLQDSELAKAMQGLQQLLVGGEALSADLAESLTAQVQGQVFNMYGPTETTIWSSIARVEGKPVYLGTPIANTQFYVVDDFGELLPPGVPGELWIGGAGVSQGYLNQAELTASRFVTTADKGRVYKTGDRVRRLANGQLQYLGRQDFQLKVRGFRIELSEIEAALCECEGVREALVIAHKTGDDIQLVAYCIGGQQALDGEVLRASLAQKLPSYMLPSAYLQLDSWPLTLSGKLNRKALPDPAGESYIRLVYEEPVGELEQMLAQIWSDLLGITSIGRRDNFFNLGGNSLVAIKLLTRVRKAGWIMEVHSLFKFPVLADLAKQLKVAEQIAIPVNAIPDHCDAITPEMVTLVALNQQEIDSIVNSVSGGAANVQDIYPLAPLQEGVLFHHLLRSKRGVYLQSNLLTFDRRERLDLFVEALQWAIKRHDIFRTSVLWETLSEPVQVVWREVPLVVEEVDLSGSADATISLSQYFDPEHYQLDVSQAPLLRIGIGFDVNENRWLALILRHHLIDDHTSTLLLLNEVLSYMQGRAAQLPEPVPFRQLVARTRLGVSRQEHESFFRNMLADVDEPTMALGVLDVYRDGSQIDMEYAVLERDLSKALRAAALALQVSTASLFHLAFARVLGSLSGRDDVVFGTVLFGRMQAGESADRALGMFINTLPIRIKLAENPLVDVLRNTYDSLADLLRHEHASLVLAQRCSGVAEPLPLFTSLLNYRHMNLGEQQQGLNWDGVSLLSGEQRSNYPLVVSVDDYGEDFGLKVQGVGLIKPAVISAYIQQVLTALVAALEMAVGEETDLFYYQLPLLNTAQRQQIVEQWNATDADYPQDKTVHALFEDQVERTPENTAVVHGDNAINYRDLNAQANCLAHYLRDLGVAAGDFVALSIERSIVLVVAELAILKCGAAYVPIDPSFPEERQAFILDDCAAQWALIVPGMALPQALPVKQLEITEALLHNTATRHNLNSAIDTEAAAYVMYTSGSTGRPKGIVTPVRAITSLVLNCAYAEFNVEDCTAFASNPAFDASTLEVWGALLHGARTLVVDQATLFTPERFSLLLQQFGVTVLFLTPALFNHYSRVVPNAFGRLRYLMTGGDNSDPEAFRRVLSHGKPQHLLHVYGQTETTTVGTTYDVIEVAEDAITIAVGMPMSNKQVYILDPQGEPVPVGVSGEIYVGGDGLALGYLNLPELTAERFIDNPFRPEPAKMYRTGDLGRWNEDGSIEFMGRNDFQVKIRGFRIELAEIESQLRQCQGLKDALVVAHKPEQNQAEIRLVAYCVLEADGASDSAALGRALTLSLPDYMLPSAYIILDEFPLDANGIVNRKALPKPDSYRSIQREYEAPIGEIEQSLAQIWSELLGVERISRWDNFFHLGGHSLLVVQLIARLRQSLSLEPALTDIFEQAVLTDLAAHLSALSRTIDFSIEPINRAQTIPLSYAQQRLWFLTQLDKQASLAYHISSGATLLGMMDQQSLRRALNALVSRHEILRTRFVLQDGSPIQQILPADTPFDLSIYPLQDTASGDMALQRILTNDRTSPFDLEGGPLIRGHLIPFSDRKHVLFVSMHHIIADGWSMGIFLQEFSALYTFYSQGTHSQNLHTPLPPLSIQYADYALWQRQWLSGELLQRQREYWQQALDGAPALLKLPVDHSRPVAQDFQGIEIPITLDAELTHGLKVLAERHGVTLHMVLLAAWAGLLARLSGQDDVVIGSPIANRRRRETEGLIGFFVNTLALRIDLSGSPTVEALLARVKAQSIAAQQHQDLPFEQVVDLLKLERSLAYTPLFQTTLAWQNAPQNHFDLPDLKFVPLDNLASTAKYDLSLSLGEFSGQITGSLIYGAALFESSTIQRYLNYWQRLLSAMVLDNRQRMDQIELLAAGEYHQLIQQWGLGKSVSQPKLCVQHLVERQTQRTPRALALECGDQGLDYQTLNGRANQLAHYLRECGVGPDKRVAVCVAHSPEMVIAVLAILKAGGAYVPMDPLYPMERLHFMLADSGAVALLTDSNNAGLFDQASLLIPLIKLTDPLPWSDYPFDNPAAGDLKPYHLAYVVYTSGSTGQPKGVMVEHQGLVNLLQWHAEMAGLKPADRSSCMAGQGFDASVLEIWPTLSVGATLLIPPPAIARDPHTVLSWWQNQSLDVSFLPTPMAELAFRHSIPATLRTLCTGGDKLRHYPDPSTSFTLLNYYGPTETTVVASAGHIHRSDSVLHIGGPISNTRLYILDRHAQLVPQGVCGELYIGGEGVARGYLNRPQLTEECFLPDPFSDEPKARMYRTGDLACWNADGTMSFLGRNDKQVKIRGFRIELGEIENALRKLQGLEDAVVIADEQGENTRLIAYCISHNKTLNSADLRRALREQLPESMVPSAYVYLPELPLTVNGKLDRQALPIPDDSAYKLTDYEAPQGEAEETLAAIWSDLLHVGKISRWDNFFALGGHSLLAVQLMSRLAEAGWQLDVRALFNTSTLAEVALQAVRGEAVTVPINGIPAGCQRITADMVTLAMLNQQDIDRITDQVHGGAGNIQDIYALAPLQEGILFHHLLDKRGDTYLLSNVLSFDQRKFLDRFIDGLQWAIDRHDILRTAILWEDLSQPVQVVSRQVSLIVEQVQIDDQHNALLELQSRFDPGHYRLDIREAPLVRLAVAFDAEFDRWLLLILNHHLVMDHTGLEILTKELTTYLCDSTSQLPLPVPFRQFVGQARLAVSQRQHEDFFKDLLADIEEPTAPLNILNVQGASAVIKEAQCRLDDHLSQRLRCCATVFGVSAASLFHLAFARVLGSLSGRDDVVFGTVLFGRMQSGLAAERTLGMFINTLPIRIDVGEVAVESSLQASHCLLTDLLYHEHASLALAQRCSSVEAPLPLFTALLNYRYSGTGTASATQSLLPEIKVLSTREHSNYPLTLSVDDLGEGFKLTAQVIDALDAKQMIAYLEQGLEALVFTLETQPQTPCYQLAVLPESERDHLLKTCSETREFAVGDCLHQIFEVQVSETPRHTALVFEDQRLSYQRLNHQANQLSHYLIEQGVGPDVLVGLCVERSIEMVVALLAILKAGGAYVPLDPATPESRLQFMLADSTPRLLISDRPISGDIPQIDITEAERWSDYPTANPVVADLRPDHLAYVIYTSGSTGEPKGVMVEHRQVGRLFAATNDWFGFTDQDVWTLFHSCAFDFSVWELWGALLHGGRLVVVPQSLARCAEDFYRLLCEQRVTVLNQTPSAFQQLQQAQQHSHDKHQLRIIILGGEALDVQSLKPWYAHNGEQTQLVNMYGVTETTVHASYRPLSIEDTEQSASPIGQRLPDLTSYILDRHHQPVPVGVIGELYIGGAGVARGYLKRAELTKARFIADPFSEDPNARLYKTGDLVCWHRDGSIEFIGRNDSQVKVRGFRIELGEIEARLREIESLDSAVVILDSSLDEKRLLAYCVSDKARWDTELLRSHLLQCLPVYMVPSVYIRLDSFPLTVNGKLDRKALPLPDGEAYSRGEYEAPIGELEESLAAIWSELLGVERVGRWDHFFALGGHSLLVVQLITRIRQTLSLDPSLADVFAKPLLADFAASLGTLSRTAYQKIEVVDRNQPIPLSYAQQRLWFLAQLDERASLAYHIAGGVTLLGPLDRQAMGKAFEAMVSRHETLRTVFIELDGEPQQRILPPKTHDVLIFQDLRSEEDQHRRWQQYQYVDSQTPFSLERGPLIRGCLLQMSDERHVLLITMHHIISDGWSLGVLLNELSVLYKAYCEKKDSPLKPLAIQYADYAVWQRKHLSIEVFEQQRHYWQQTLAHAPALLNLPTDYPRPIEQDYRGTQYRVLLDAELSQRLKHLSEREGVTLHMVLLTAWAVLLAQLSAQDEVVIGTPIANRQQGEVEGLIGFFVNTLALRIDVSGSPEISELLNRVKAQSIAAQHHQDLPFEQVVEQLGIERSLSYTPLFQVIFGWQNAPQGEFDLAGLQIAPLDNQSTIAKYDLSLSLGEVGDEITGSLIYANALFEEKTIARYMGFWKSLLARMCEE